MNTNLIEKMYEFKSNLRKETNTFIDEYNNCVDATKKKSLKERIISLKEKYNEISKALNDVKTSIDLYNSDPEMKDEYFKSINALKNIADINHVKYEILEDNVKTVNKSETKKSNVGRNILIGLGLVGVGAGLSTCAMNNNCYDSEEINEDEESKSLFNFNELFKRKNDSEDITKYGMTSEFTDAKNETQVMKRAQDIYNKYVNIEGVPEAIKSQLSVDRLANVIRMFNGELPRENGDIDYSTYTSLDEVSNIYASYCNSTSLVEYGTDLKFKPSCVFFEKDSLAHASAAKNDSLLEKIYSDIQARDVETFRADSVKWGEFVRDTFVYNDFTGETISLKNIDAGQQFPLACSIISPYMPSVFEFSLNTDLATREGTMGNTFGICIPYCYNASNELEYIPLSKLIYDINYTPINALAVRAGMESEINNITDPIIVQSYNTTSDYYESKYSNEMGYTRQLK